MNHNRDFQIELAELDRSNRKERLLDELLHQYLNLDEDINDKNARSIDLLNLYLSVIRSRNHLRRNWHPMQSIRCNMMVIGLIEKQGGKDKFNKMLDIALININKGDVEEAARVVTKLKEDFNKQFDEGQANIAKTERKHPFKNEIAKCINRLGVCSFDELLECLRSKEGNGVIIKVYEDAVEHKNPEKPNLPNKIRPLNTVRNDLTTALKKFKNK